MTLLANGQATLQNALIQKCLTIPSAVPIRQIQQQDCNGISEQLWTLHAK